MTALYIVVAILVLSFLVLVHEAGHFWAARLTGMPVKEFNIGFGKKLWSRKRNGVVYSLRLILFGGYVSFADSDEEDSVANYYRQPVWKRITMTLAGPLMNFLLAFVVMVVFCLAGGVQTPIPLIAEVTENSPAAQAGLQVGDKFISINNTAIGDDYQKLLSMIANSRGEDLNAVVQRNGELVSLRITPMLNEQEQRYVIGVTPGSKPYPMPFGQSLSFSFDTMVDVVKALLQFLGGLFKGQGTNDIASPIGIVDAMTQQAQQYGLQSFITIGIFISVNLGLFNLLPIPGLDGSKIIFLTIEGIRRKPVPPEKEGVITAIGFGFFILLFVFLAGRDVARLFGWVQGP
jgi:regulator of sigma E protease